MASIHLLILYFGYFVESYYYGKEMYTIYQQVSMIVVILSIQL